LAQATGYGEQNLGLMLEMKQAHPESLKMAALCIATIPIILVYPFLQKYFTKGIVIGAVKG